jgi:hypothetical protein
VMLHVLPYSFGRFHTLTHAAQFAFSSLANKITF